MLRSASRRFTCLLLLICTSWATVTSSVSAEKLTPTLQAEFGAAAWIPADAGLFCASYRGLEQWEAFTKTEAFNELFTMPGVQMGLAFYYNQIGQLNQLRAENRLLDQGIKVLQDAASQEMFVYVDSRGPKFLSEVGEMYNWFFMRSLMRSIESGGKSNQEPISPEVLKELFELILAKQEDFRVPGIVFGARLANPQAGRDLIEDLRPLLEQLLPAPLALQEETLAGGEYLTLQLNAGELLQPQHLSEIAQELSEGGLDEETIAEVLKFIQSQTLSISIGMRDDYLILSIGADNSHLSSMGKGVSLAESDVLSPIRKHFKSRLVGLSYVHADFISSKKISTEETIAYLKELVGESDLDLPAGLETRVTADVTEALNEFNTFLPEPQPYMASTFWNEGYESFSFSALTPGSMDASGPLSILAHGGPAPILAWASKSQPSLDSYNRLAYWIQTAYGYFEDYGIPNIPEENLADSKRFESIVIPAWKRFHIVTRDSLIPAIDGGQSLCVLDAGGLVTKIPTTQEPILHPIRFPRPAIVFELKDRKLFLAACNEYRDIYNQLMLDVAAKDPADLTVTQLPLPESRSDGDGTIYTYTIPAKYHVAASLNDDFEPHVLLTDDYLVFALSPRHSRRLMASNSLASPPGLVDLQQPAGSAVWFDFRVLKELICDDVDAGLSLVVEEGNIEKSQANFIRLHVRKVRRALDAVHNYRSRTYEEEGRRVTHGWLKLQDIER